MKNRRIIGTPPTPQRFKTGDLVSMRIPSAILGVVTGSTDDDCVLVRWQGRHNSTTCLPNSLILADGGDDAEDEESENDDQEEVK
jgi:hypothetical protein